MDRYQGRTTIFAEIASVEGVRPLATNLGLLAFVRVDLKKGHFSRSTVCIHVPIRSFGWAVVLSELPIALGSCLLCQQLLNSHVDTVQQRPQGRFQVFLLVSHYKLGLHPLYCASLRLSIVLLDHWRLPVEVVYDIAPPREEPLLLREWIRSHYIRPGEDICFVGLASLEAKGDLEKCFSLHLVHLLELLLGSVVVGYEAKEPIVTFFPLLGNIGPSVH